MKILLFGNGVSIRFKPNEYTYDKLVLKFVEGLEFDVKRQRPHSPLLKNSKISEIFKNKEIFDESIFFEIYKTIVLSAIDSGYGSGIKINQLNFENANDVWERVYSAILNDEKINSLPFHIFFWFKCSYESIIYALQRSISLNYTNDDFIRIPFTEKFKQEIVRYDKVLTTNYYIGINNEELNIEFVHGKLNYNKDFVFSTKSFDRKHTMGQEFGNSQILFGSKYKDKIFLNSIINSTNNILERRLPKSIALDFTDSEVDIVGLSVEGDQDLINKIIYESKKVNIFYHTQDDKLKWTIFIRGKSNCEIKQDTEFQGFFE